MEIVKKGFINLSGYTYRKLDTTTKVYTKHKFNGARWHLSYLVTFCLYNLNLG